MRFCEIISESFLTELKSETFKEEPYKGFTIKYSTVPAFENKTKYGAVGTTDRGEMINGTKPHLADSQEEAINNIKHMIDSDIEIRQTSAFNDAKVTQDRYSMNFNTKFTNNIMKDNKFNTYIKIFSYKGNFAFEIATKDFIDMFTESELKQYGFQRLTDRMSSGKAGGSFMGYISGKNVIAFDLIPRGRYAIDETGEVSDDGNPIYVLDYHSYATNKHDKRELNFPALTIATTVKGGQD